MWRARVVVREIGAGLAAEAWRAVVIVAVVVGLVSIVTVVELGQIQDAVDTDTALSNAGRYVFVAFADGDSAPIDPRRCLAIDQNPAVKATGGFTETGRVRIEKAPGELLRLRSTIGRTVAMLSPDSTVAPGDIYVAQPAAQRIGLRTGTTVVLGDEMGPAEMSVVDMSARIPDPGPWLWSADGPVLPLDECWVEVNPSTATGASDWISAWLSQGAGTIGAVPFLGEDRFRLDPQEAFHTRPTKFAWLVGGVAIGLLLTLVLWFRRSEIALYRTVGSSAGQTALLLGTPYVILVAMGAVGGVLLGLYLHGLAAPLSLPLYGAALRQATLMASTATLITIAAALATSAGNISDYIRQKL
jgi:hypothetical protein